MIVLCGVAQAQGFVGFTLGPALGTAETPLFTCGGGHMCMYMTRTEVLDVLDHGKVSAPIM